MHKEEMSQTISFWSEEIRDGQFTWNVTVANTSQGVCWVGLGPYEAEEQDIKAWSKRWVPKAIVIKNKLPNELVLNQLKEYFSGTRKEFDIPLDIMGTSFQTRVWNELTKIPYGETRSYSDIAFQVENPKGQRAVGLANNKNPIGVIVPCHRVIGKKGGLVGYAGGIHLKERLLMLEQQKNRN